MYGWQLTILATSGIVFLGFLKAFGTFNKVPSKAKKYLYYAISCILSILACTGYILLKNGFEWRAYLILIAGIIGYTSAIYTLYENTGIRDLLKKLIFTPIKKLLSKILQHIVKGTLTKDAVIDLASDYGKEIANEIIESAKEKEQEKKQVETKTEEKQVAVKPFAFAFPSQAKAEQEQADVKVEKKTSGRAGMQTINTPNRK